MCHAQLVKCVPTLAYTEDESPNGCDVCGEPARTSGFRVQRSCDRRDEYCVAAQPCIHVLHDGNFEICGAKNDRDILRYGLDRGWLFGNLDVMIDAVLDSTRRAPGKARTTRVRPSALMRNAEPLA